MKMNTLVLVVLLAGCKEKVHVNVNCETTAAPAVECTLDQDKGKGEVEVCFDWSATCENGTIVKAPRTCGKVKDGGKATVTIPGDQLTDLGKCAGTKPPTAKVENLVLKGV
jgi:hypothetical protein